MSLSFLKDFKKAVAKAETVNVGLGGPGTWISTGNYALNRSLSGSFAKGIPLGRVTLFAGPSGSGKSYISSNCMKSAQDEGFHLLVLDTENAIDTDYLSKIGVDISEERLTYIQITTFEDMNAVCSEFFQSYIKAYGKNNPDSPKVLIVIDSLAMLTTVTEFENYEKGGVVKGDQGARSKKQKASIRQIISYLARLPIACICTDHVYPQDIMLGDGAWCVNNGLKYSCSIIGMVTKLKLKEGTEVVGVRMRFETYKSRFAKLGTKIELEVPYNKGMSSFSGLTDMLSEMGVLVKDGHSVRADFPDGTSLKFKPRDITQEICDRLFTHPLANPTVTENIEEPEIEDLLEVTVED